MTRPRAAREHRMGTAKKTSAKKAGAKRGAAKKRVGRRVRVRTYRHGLGDCHLLSFTKPDGTPAHVLIDCGVVNRTENPVPLMTGVAQDIARESGGVLDLVIVTHQHT